MTALTARDEAGRFVAVDAFERFYAKVVEQDRGYATPCWIWTGGTTDQGYGLFWLGTSVLAHRFAYELIVGPIPDGLELDHLCRVTACVRPLHLDPVTPRENVHRSDSPMGINARLERCRKGHEFTGAWRGRRTCRTCATERQRAHRARAAA